jgi:hypothetical protein
VWNYSTASRMKSAKTKIIHSLHSWMCSESSSKNTKMSMSRSSLNNAWLMKSKFTQRRYRAPKRSSCAMCKPQQRGWADKNGATGASDMAGKAVR